MIPRAARYPEVVIEALRYMLRTWFWGILGYTAVALGKLARVLIGRDTR